MKIAPRAATLANYTLSKAAVEFAEAARLWAHSELISCGIEMTERSSTRAHVCQATMKIAPRAATLANYVVSKAAVELNKDALL